jgi:uncharacterized membrane protein
MLKTFFVTLALVLSLDFVWLGFVVTDFNLRQLSAIARIDNGAFSLLISPAILVYLLMAASIALFSLPRAASANTDLEAFLWGAGLGLVIYGIYDLTNLAILKNYPLGFALADMAWGTFLYGFVTFLVARKL